MSIDVSGLLVGAGAAPPEPLNNLLYAHGSTVRHVLTDGNLQVVDGEVVVADQDEVVRRGGEAAQVLWDRLADEGFFTETPR